MGIVIRDDGALKIRGAIKNSVCSLQTRGLQRIQPEIFRNITDFSVFRAVFLHGFKHFFKGIHESIHILFCYMI